MEKEVCLILDAHIDYETVFLNAKNALMGGADKIFIRHPKSYNQNEMARIIEMCHNYDALLLFYDDLEYAEVNNADGIYFGSQPPSNVEIKSQEFIIGVDSKFQTKLKTSCHFVTIESPNQMDSVKELADGNSFQVYANLIDKKDLSKFSETNIAGIVIEPNLEEIADIIAFVKQIKSNLN